MVTRRKSDDALPFLFRGQRLNLVCCAPDLERSGTLKVFALEKNFLAGDVIELTRCDYWRAMNAAGDAFPGFPD